MTLPTLGQQLEVTAERLGFGGFAIARHDGLAVFVPFAAPGDRLRVEITEVQKNFVRARIVELLTPGPGRVTPRCRHFGECGGCQFQHVDQATQVAAKAEFLRDALVRTAGFEWPQPVVVHHAEPWGYRARTQLKVYSTSGERPDGSHGRMPKRQRRAQRAAAIHEATGNGEPDPAPELGFHRAFTHDVLDIEQCPVLAPELEQGLPAVRAAIAELPMAEWPYQVDGACGSGIASWSPDLPGLRKDLVEHRVGAFRYLIEPESFFQGNRHLVQRLVEGAIGDERGGLAFDLYAGVGLFTMPLSKRFARVVSVEDERRAATLGRVNVKSNGCDNVSYLRSTTEQFLRSNKERPDLVLMDPPRQGAKPALALLLKLRPQRLVYVSCDPQTLARDLRQLVDGGYTVEQVEGYDMFPQTFHVEAVARLRLADGARQ
jgi:23S rRNA (uracil1939-C5)-methyltransferase